MTTQTETLKLALEALEDLQLCTDDYYESSHEASKKGDKAITAIKEALAVDKESLTTEAQQSNEQVEPVAWRCRMNGHWSFKSYDVAGLVCEPLYTHPPVPTAQPKEPEQEPVAWMYEDMQGFVGIMHQKEKPIVARPAIPLYTHPPVPTAQPKEPQRKPLTDEQIAEIATTPAAIPGSYIHSFARAIEASHGIK